MNNNLKSFTMAEILLSLTIIGVVAAITLPSLTGNINERTWQTQRKALYARMSQAIALMGNLNGYGISTTQEQTMSNAAKIFVTNGLAKVYKINNICDAEHLSDCGIPAQITKQGTKSKIDIPITLRQLNSVMTDGYGTWSYSQINTYAAAFETANGESIITYYYPYCTFLNNPNVSTYLQPTMCANFIFDLNGKKGPNTVGKDIGFMSVFYPSDSQVAMPYPIRQVSVHQLNEEDAFTISYANNACRNQHGEEAHVANSEELKSIFINNSLGTRPGSSVGFLMYDGFRAAHNAQIALIQPYSGQFIILDVSQLTFHPRGYENVFCVK